MDDFIKQSRILIVDDSPAAVQLLKLVLKRDGFTQVRGLNDPREIISIYQEWQPDLVLLDLMMPVFNGFKVMETTGQI